MPQMDATGRIFEIHFVNISWKNSLRLMPRDPVDDSRGSGNGLLPSAKPLPETTLTWN